MAEEYDRHRPTYPRELMDELTDLRPARVLDVGCGTGRNVVALAERGLSVLGVERDERMRVAAFEA
ncbi:MULTISPECIES: class I SAM-dependent methyltransferase [Streptomyces]|uniref:class I SAM-dependent methyltransferase n=1 Tax=Streptomyces TaxID=1883 RepID=UPI001D055CB6|nr:MULTISPECIES: methyltransferase domain-containing protein [Streptomyces]